MDTGDRNHALGWQSSNMDKFTEIDIDLQEAIRLINEKQYDRAKFFVEGSLKHLREWKVAQKTWRQNSENVCNCEYPKVYESGDLCRNCGKTILR